MLAFVHLIKLRSDLAHTLASLCSFSFSYRKRFVIGVAEGANFLFNHFITSGKLGLWHIVKTPMRRVKHAVFIVGTGGTGKSSVLDVIETALAGKHVNRSSTYSEIFDKFSETLVNNRVVGIEDKAIARGHDTNVYTNLKQIIDYNQRTVSIKHQQRSVVREMYSQAKAREAGKHMGRSAKLDKATQEQVRKEAAAGANKAKLAKDNGISRATLYAILKATT
ncbi:hypothetical protein SAMN05216319_3951 [Duganella sp. CF402]|uniref:DUF5906 domain-containing protein n=1 Tax=unclassified Duganella TaxID=2636909 RepID=UPI0008BAFF5F|nr:MULTISPECIES: DUF5906 domain-containing protein [unclassified Duganella]RZT04270.1 hypothetical protein EV582_5154 [Duganella sp. BK701]SEM42030.1 hypothetical protein SAMN05216319_3951 [Duganella sp. CF402]